MIDRARILAKILTGGRTSETKQDVPEFNADIAWALYQQGLVAREIGEFFSKTPNTIRWHLRKFPGYRELAQSNRGVGSADQKFPREKALALRKSGQSFQAIGRALGVSFTTVYAALKDFDVVPLPRPASTVPDISLEWTTDDERVAIEITLHQAGLSIAKISDLIGISRSGVYREIGKHPDFVGKNPLDPNEVIEFHRQGMSVVKIAMQLGVSVNKIAVALKKHPDYVPLSRLKVDTVEAWRLYQNGRTSQEIGEIFGVADSVVRYHLRKNPGYAEIAAANVAGKKELDKRFPPKEAWCLYQEGHTLQQIADRYGVHVASVHNGIKDFPGYRDISSRRDRYNRL